MAADPRTHQATPSRRYELREGHLIVDTTPNRYPGSYVGRDRQPEPVAAVWHEPSAELMVRMLNDLDDAREHAATDIQAAADRRCDDLRAELQRHQLAMTKAAEKRITETSDARAADALLPVGVRIALDAVARDYIRRAVNAAMDRDSVGHEDYPEIGEYDFIRARDRAVALVVEDPTLPYTVADAVEHLALRTTSAEPDQVAGEPPVELPPFPAPLGGGS